MKGYSLNRQRGLIAILLALAVIGRLVWAMRRGWASQAGEANNVAVALASGRGFSDPYFFHSGPTAHLMPTTPVVAGGVYWLLGIRSTAAEIVLQLIASTEMVIGYVLLFILFGRLDVSLRARTVALAVLCLIPVFMGPESLDFRYWEGGVAVLLSAAALIMLYDLDAQEKQPDYRQILIFSGLFAVTFFVNAPLGLGIGACSLVLLLKKRSWAHRWAMLLTAGVALCAIITPWAIRNQAALGSPVLLRSNMGLELLIANNDAQVTMPHKEAFNLMMTAVHPSGSAASRVQLASLGEVKYMKTLLIDTKAWIQTHPWQFVQLCARHFRQMLLPDSFEFETGSGSFSRLRALGYSLISILGLTAIVVSLVKGHLRYVYIAIIVATVIITYIPFQPMARYLYLNYGLLVFSACSLLDYAKKALGAKNAMALGAQASPT